MTQEPDEQAQDHRTRSATIDQMAYRYHQRKFAKYYAFRKVFWLSLIAFFLILAVSITSSAV